MTAAKTDKKFNWYMYTLSFKVLNWMNASRVVSVKLYYGLQI